MVYFWQIYDIETIFSPGNIPFFKKNICLQISENEKKRKIQGISFHISYSKKHETDAILKGVNV
ncbi:hypothetical protein D7Y05_01585 [bacterium 1XD42-54]|nr:hypothetical protein D7Y05_01585 [bacterium 1XD42-54]